MTRHRRRWRHPVRRRRRRLMRRRRYAAISFYKTAFCKWQECSLPFAGWHPAMAEWHPAIRGMTSCEHIYRRMASCNCVSQGAFLQAQDAFLPLQDAILRMAGCTPPAIFKKAFCDKHYCRIPPAPRGGEQGCGGGQRRHIGMLSSYGSHGGGKHGAARAPLLNG